jgi:SAM-dependent methyltransferase
MNPDEQINPLPALAALLRATGDPLRLRLLHILTAEELSVGELVRVLQLPQSTISRHLKGLKEQGLVADRPSGPNTYYRAVVEAETHSAETAVRDSLVTTLRQSPLPTEDRNGLELVLASRGLLGDEFFDRVGLRWDQLREECFGPAFHFEAFLQLLPREWAVADLGTGTGYLLPSLSRHFRQVVAVDNSTAMLDLARRRVAESGAENVDLREGDLEHLPLTDGGIDLALAFLMLHHLNDVRPALREIRRILRPGGQLLLVEIYPHQNESFRVAMADRRPGLDPATLSAMASEAGLRPAHETALDWRDRPAHDLAPLPRTYALRCFAPAALPVPADAPAAATSLVTAP